ncbi:hypothetical protein L1987_54424 [Smallanthus sonchifolius]|uniref:Uncharacterized protein n=1 Tax=Smallanthus sonchifolius TaxID=185202 RepID=A0ACB9E737_9ASTR|nr:hypothetical protein L1987_54424 [Smallanthus sonchifolius]
MRLTTELEKAKSNFAEAKFKVDFFGQSSRVVDILETQLYKPGNGSKGLGVTPRQGGNARRDVHEKTEKSLESSAETLEILLKTLDCGGFCSETWFQLEEK